MLSWLRRRRDEAQRADADAAALIAEGRPRAYSEARRREREAADAENAQHGAASLALLRGGWASGSGSIRQRNAD